MASDVMTAGVMTSGVVTSGVMVSVAIAFGIITSRGPVI